MIHDLLAAHRGKAIASVIALAAVTAFAVLGFVLPAGHGAATVPGRSTQATAPVVPSGAPGIEAQGSTVLSAQELAQLDAAPTVAPGTSRLLPPIAAEQRTQPDLYARAFFTALFVHPYAGVSRTDMLASVQTQQATSTFITGGTPAQLNRLLVESASDPAWSNHGFAALPDDAGWAQAASGRARVRIDRLTCITPPDWETAIADGDITDPSITPRLVSGDLSMTFTHSGRSTTQRLSVALTLLLEAPPAAQARYGVVVIADTNVVETS